ncbi:uncharacterized protein LOC111713615 isoform X2 [Eurytemora carolleeae]|uniref:uncharacterized protein LOC111713615 isoform X2 n=1 Tax=Eurytemora carolleeae TaxID=1294199 RepID=UPI000C765E1E|nr:uncharacterized protein LOC111713615 isoform X2 [Eurytemora carolleeae]|eukprot:XP_023344280.1 uncharacterized protein LOC111713615 isoform X2 [Eurytemora affinis]
MKSRLTRLSGVLRRLVGPVLLVLGGVVFGLAVLSYPSMYIARFNGPGNTLDYCQLILAESNEVNKETILERLGLKYVVEEVDFPTMLAVVDECRIKAVDESVKDVDTEMGENEYFKLFRGILPGTLWCGYDDLAPTYDSLGPATRLDSCCRAHDHCPLKVKALQSRYGVLNLHPYTKVACECDTSFYNCLKRVGSEKSNAVGNFFFNIIQIQCLQKDSSRNCSNSRSQRSFYNFRQSLNSVDCKDELFYKPVNRNIKY